MKRLVLLLLLVPSLVFAAHQYPERDYQKAWCDRAGGVMEYRLDDGARVDCLTATHAVEFDFSAKWAEAIGQALFYGIKTGKAPGVVLILEGPNDQKHLDRLQAVADKYGIKVWTMGKGDL